MVALLKYFILWSTGKWGNCPINVIFVEFPVECHSNVRLTTKNEGWNSHFSAKWELNNLLLLFKFKPVLSESMNEILWYTLKELESVFPSLIRAGKHWCCSVWATGAPAGVCCYTPAMLLLRALVWISEYKRLASHTDSWWCHGNSFEQCT